MLRNSKSENMVRRSLTKEARVEHKTLARAGSGPVTDTLQPVLGVSGAARS